MKQNNRIFLFVANIIVMMTGFLLPIYISRVIPSFSDSAFFYLSILNPLIIFFGFDQRKQIVLGSKEENSFHSKIRFNFILLILVVSIIVFLNLNSLFFLPILLIKMISFSLDIHNGILQVEKKFIYLCFLRIIEIILLLAVIFFDPKLSILLLVIYMVFLIYNWRGKMNLRVWEFIKKKYSLGLQGTCAAMTSAIGIYILKLTGNDYLITELAIQATILSAVYMSQSIYLNSIMDQFKEIGNKKSVKKLFAVNLFFVSFALLVFMFFHIFNLFEFIFNKETDFSFLSLYAFLFMLLHMLKNSQFIYSFLIAKSETLSKFKIIISFLYLFSLILPVDLNLKFLIVILVSTLEFYLTFKYLIK